MDRICEIVVIPDVVADGDALAAALAYANRVRRDRIDQAGVITVRVAGRLHHIGVGRTYTGTRVLILIQDLRQDH
jgi:hypothetical protein